MSSSSERPSDRDKYLVQNTQELYLLSGSPKYLTPPEFYIPHPIIEGRLSIEQTRKLRREYKFFLSPDPVRCLHLDLEFNAQRVAMSFEDLDPIQGVTLSDPKILGLWDEEKEIIIPVTDRDLTLEYYENLIEMENDPQIPENVRPKHYLRDPRIRS